MPKQDQQCTNLTSKYLTRRWSNSLNRNIPKYSYETSPLPKLYFKSVETHFMVYDRMVMVILTVMNWPSCCVSWVSPFPRTKLRTLLRRPTRTKMASSTTRNSTPWCVVVLPKLQPQHLLQPRITFSCGIITFAASKANYCMEPCIEWEMWVWNLF